MNFSIASMSFTSSKYLRYGEHYGKKFRGEEIETNRKLPIPLIWFKTGVGSSFLLKDRAAEE